MPKQKPPRQQHPRQACPEMCTLLVLDRWSTRNWRDATTVGRLINRKDGDRKETDPPLGARSLFINGVRYANAAAKFWSSLIDEVRRDFAACSAIELSALSPAGLESDLLYPQRALEKDIGRFIFADMKKMMTETIAELEIIGPPSAVNIRLLKADEELYAGDMALDCVDSEIFPYLIVWPLAWAGVHDATWNNDRLVASFSAEDKARRLIYSVSFEVLTRHVSEGLFSRSFTAVPAVAPMT